jgi:hypothetical protein
VSARPAKKQQPVKKAVAKKATAKATASEKRTNNIESNATRLADKIQALTDTVREEAEAAATAAAQSKAVADDAAIAAANAEGAANDAAKAAEAARKSSKRFRIAVLLIFVLALWGWHNDRNDDRNDEKRTAALERAVVEIKEVRATGQINNCFTQQEIQESHNKLTLGVENLVTTVFVATGKARGQAVDPESEIGKFIKFLNDDLHLNVVSVRDCTPEGIAEYNSNRKTQQP